jgi:hypothetical protein
MFLKKILVIIFCLVTILASVPIISLISNEALALRVGSNFPLSNADGSYRGEAGFDASGRAAKIIEDVNGDGYDDLLISAFYNDEGGHEAGQTYLIFGKSIGFSNDISLSNANASFWGEASDDYSGGSIASAGDVNGDGYGDFLISATGNDDNGTGTGAAYLIFGKAGGWKKDFNLSQAPVEFHGEKEDNYLGTALAGGGDVNGDGFDDFLITSWGNDEAAIDAGKVYLFFGGNRNWPTDINVSDANASFLGENKNDRAGSTVIIPGDLNGDGFDDMVIAAPIAQVMGIAYGRIYIIFGKAGGWNKGTSLSKADASYKGNALSSGEYMAGAGDANKDGYNDFLISSGGRAYLIFGRNSNWKKDVTLNNTNSNASFYWIHTPGGVPWSFFSLAGVGDVNGDGYDDLLFVDSNLIADLFLGKKSGWAKDTPLTNANASFVAELGYGIFTVGGKGDVNGDGYDDVILGSPTNGEVNWESGETYLVFPDLNSKPSTISSIKAYSDPSYSMEMTETNMNTTAYIQVNGTDTNASRRDFVIVNISSNVSSPMAFQLRLMETGVNTGVYRNNFTLFNRTDESKRWIRATGLEQVFVAVRQDPTKNLTINVNGFTILPLKDQIYATEDLPYKMHYWTVGEGCTPVDWSFTSDAKWLKWDPITHNISGTPDNSHVGQWNVHVRAAMRYWAVAEHNFKLTVNNTPPDILIKDVQIILEDHLYNIDYNSTDDGLGNITYHLATNASSWLAVNQNTGILSGIPKNEDVGWYHVNITVDDGHGGKDWSNFTLTVVNTNDIPIILTTDNKSVLEDSPYHVQYTALDVDVGDQLRWNFSTSGARWLSMDLKTGIVSGIPENQDVGDCWVNVSVRDKALARSYHNFTLKVINTNDAPVIMTKDNTTALEDELYSIQYEIIDVDKYDVDLVNFSTNAKWLTWNEFDFRLKGIPKNEDVGAYWVNITVRDMANATDMHNFTLTVVNTNDPPWINSTPNNTAVAQLQYKYQVLGFDVDRMDVLTYSLVNPPIGMTIDAKTGLLRWTPTKEQKGNYFIIVKVTDIAGANSTQGFGLKVYIPPFYAPEAFLVLPLNGKTVDTTYPILSWQGKDLDNDLITYDIYLSTHWDQVNSTDPSVRVIMNTTSTDAVPSSRLVKGVTYYWTVIPRDDRAIGSCGNGIWQFNVSPLAKDPNVPTLTISRIEDAIVGVPYELKFNGFDKDNDPLTYSLNKAPQNMTIDPKTGLVKWVPSPGQTGNNLVVTRVSDGLLFCDLAETIRVLSIPILDPIPDQHLKAGKGFYYVLKAKDYDNGHLTFSLLSGPDGFIVNENGSIVWKPTTKQHGSFNVTVMVSDGWFSDYKTFNVTVEKAPDRWNYLNQSMVLVLILIFVIIAGICVLLYFRGRKKKEMLQKEFFSKRNALEEERV